MSFTWFDKFTDAFEAMGDDPRADALKVALVDYAVYGELKELDDPLMNAFLVLCAADIKFSQTSRDNGKRGGRPRKAPAETTSETPVETPVETQVKTPVSQDGKPPSETPSETTRQYKTGQDKTLQDKTVEGDARARRFTPPTASEVDEYARGRGTPIDAERFCDFYASKGWKVGKSPMRDWKAAARNWAKRDGEERDGPHAADPANPDGGWLR